MNISNSYVQDLENARKAAEAARKKAETAKATVEKETLEATLANDEVNKANENITLRQSEYTLANEKVTAKQAELDNALANLASLQASGDEEAINNAQAEVDRLRAELDKVKEDAQKEYEELIKAQQDAQTALARAEIEQKEADASVKELEIAEQELAEAEAALLEAEAAAEAAAAEEVKLENEVKPLTEAEAIEQGYTVIKTAEDLQAVANNLSGKYILMNDIDLAGIEWQPIGNMDPTALDPWAGAFKGEFNGNGFSIMNLTVAADESDNAVGLFGATDGAKITNTRVLDANVSAPEEYNETSVGILIGTSRDTDIDNIAVSGNVTGHQGVGGLIGLVDDSGMFDKTDITNVNANVDVKASFYAGGLIGRVSENAHGSLMLDNCHTKGQVVVADSCAGGLIGEAGKTVVTVNSCSSSMDIARESDLPSELSWLLDNSKIGGIIGNCNGTYISICNSNFTGSLDSDDEFKGENYGYYMNDAQVSIFDVSSGLPVDDILNIEGVEAITPTVDPQTGVAHYEITVSTLAGMNRIVDMIQSKPELAEVISFNIQFDFEGMDATYDHSNYNQYGVVQHLYEDSEGNIVNDVYIDNEIDLESTFNTGVVAVECEPDNCPDRPEPTMVAGLYKKDGKYYVLTGEKGGKYENFTEVTLAFFFENKANIRKRLEKEQVMLRNELVNYARSKQAEFQEEILKKYGYTPDKVGKFIIQEPEYKALKKKEAEGKELTNDEKLKIELFELNYNIMNIVGEITHNEGCGMGGDASFLEKDTGIPLEDEWGRIRYMTLSGFEVRQKVDENGELMFDEEGNPLYETLEGENYDGSEGEPYIVRGYPITNEEGGFLYTDEEGKTVVRTDNEDGSQTYAYEDGTPFNGDPETLTQQLEEQTPKQMADELTQKLDELGEEEGLKKTKEEKDETEETV